jgi:hypothetical protein
MVIVLETSNIGNLKSKMDQVDGSDAIVFYFVCVVDTGLVLVPARIGRTISWTSNIT